METLKGMFTQVVNSFIEDEALTRGAAIAFYTVTSLAPLLLIVIAIAGLFIDAETVRNAIVGQLGGLVGSDSSELFRAMVAGTPSKSTSILSTIIGSVTLLATVTGVFGELQSALNAIWKVETKKTTVARFIRARAASAGLVTVLGFLLLVSLLVSTALTALSGHIQALLAGGEYILFVLNTLISFSLITFLFGAIYKVLPDRDLEWRDVLIGAVLTAVLFTLGKVLISWYLGSSGVTSRYGAGGALILILLWVYYSVMIVLVGAEFTKAYAQSHGSKKGETVEETTVKL